MFSPENDELVMQRNATFYENESHSIFKFYCYDYQGNVSFCTEVFISFLTYYLFDYFYISNF